MKKITVSYLRNWKKNMKFINRIPVIRLKDPIKVHVNRQKRYVNICFAKHWLIKLKLKKYNELYIEFFL